MKHFNSKDAEMKWSQMWQEKQIYLYEEDSSKEVFSVDTPPPTVSGSLHIGHLFSYSHTDIICRFKRMMGQNVFYPMGWDDNGLPSERRVQNYYHIQCNPLLDYEENLLIEKATSKIRKGPYRDVSTKNFIELCRILTSDDEKAFKELWNRIGLSVDWTKEYSTMSKNSIMISQKSFIDLYNKGELYNKPAPVMWDIDFKTAVAQAELEERQAESNYHYIDFTVETGEIITVATTRPELLPACVAITAHKDDQRYKHLFGLSAETPLFSVPVLIFPSDEASPDKGTGIVMVCTFGDTMDVQWWKSEKLKLRQAINEEGRYLSIDFSTENWRSNQTKIAQKNMNLIEGKTLKQGKIIILELLEKNGSINRSSTSIKHSVPYYEKGKRPIEILSSRQWFLSMLNKKNKLLRMGEEIQWYPEHMKKRYLNWTENIRFDWCISRQRYFGVPIPLWYKIDEKGGIDRENPILPLESQLPLYPSLSCPPGYDESQRGKKQGFIGEKDILDTWFTSSLTRQLSGFKDSLMSIRPQSHEIIRTWTLYTIVKSMLHKGIKPWNNILISGWILDKDRMKMSKSVGNGETPQHWLDKYGSDSVRYWAAHAKLGIDTTFDEFLLKKGRKLVTKIFNASKFVSSFELPASTDLTAIDLSLLHKLDCTIIEATESFNAFHFSKALELIEDFFWKDFTDMYLELVKKRAKAKNYSAIFTLQKTNNILLKLFAPFLPFITEEVWSWDKSNKSKSIHLESWPEPLNDQNTKNLSLINLAEKCLRALHSEKTKSALSLKEPVKKVTFSISTKEIELFSEIELDVKNAGNISDIKLKIEEQENEEFIEVIF